MKCDLILGDCYDILPTLANVDAIVTDPPYGCKNDCDYTRFSGGLHSHRNKFERIAGDATPFDPAPFLSFPRVALCGYHHFANVLPVGSVGVWIKKRDSQLGSFLSDAELVWIKGGKGVYVFRHVWNGFDRESERGHRTLHPTQKPVPLFTWLIDRLKLKPGDTLVDPFMGVGGSGIAAKKAGLNYIGIEIDPDYYQIAKERIDCAT